MIHCIDAENRVEAIVIKGQTGVCIRYREAYSASLIRTTRHPRSRGHALLIRIHSSDAAPNCLGQVESRTTGACGDLEQMRFRRQPKPGKKTIIFIDRQPAVLANVDAESFLSDDLKNVLVKLAVGIPIEIAAFCHVNPCYGSIVRLTSSRSATVGGSERGLH